MTRGFKTQYFLPVILLAFITGCSDPKAVIDRNTDLNHHTWSYDNLVKYDVKIDDNKLAYNLYLNLRVTGEYKYSNIFILIHQTGPDKKPMVTRYEFTLANKDGEWYGKGSGDLYSYQISFKTNYHFPTAGNYHFDIEQNMRDNPLHEVSDVGLRVEKVTASNP